jgi:MFS family permease
VTAIELGIIRTKIPSRLDRLPWSRFHWRIIIGLGTAWILDGLEVTIVGSVASRMTQAGSGIPMTSSGIGIAAATYVAGACSGALVFGYLTDRFGRRRLFMITLGIYMVATAITAVSFSPWFFWIFRFLTGTGIGGEYAAVNSAIDELIPARARGNVDLVINGSFWVGSIIGSALAILFLDEAFFAADVGWRLSFAIGIILGSAVLLVRRHVPESPRWLFIHGRDSEAEALVDGIESEVAQETGAHLTPVTKTLTVRQRRSIGFGIIVQTAVKVYLKRSILCVALFVGQAFLYNGITFNLGTLMSTFFGVTSGFVPVFLIMYATSNFLGPLLLGRLFDTVGRIPMISITYLGSSALGLLLAGLFTQAGLLGRWSFIAVVMATFFLASSGASAAYLTASEIFPMETRALAIAFFYAIGTAVGGIVGPLLFGPLIATGSHGLVAVAFLIGAALMTAGGVAELLFGVKAEGTQLEDIAKPLTVEEAEQEQAAAGKGVTPHGTAPAAGVRRPQEAVPSAGQAPARQDATAGRRAAAAGHRAAAARHRAQAAGQRAAAARHRAQAAEQRAAAAQGDPEAAGRAQVEEILAEISEARALAEDERAAAAGQRAAMAGSEAAGEPEKTQGRQAEMAAAGHDDDCGPAGRRAAASELRARSHEEEAEALAATDTREADRHRALAEAALEHARAAEQQALAAEARAAAAGAGRVPPPTQAGDGAQAANGKEPAAADDQGRAAGDGQARAGMHDLWAQMHEELARAHEYRAAGQAEAAAQAEQAAGACAERARAASYRIEAAEREAQAEAERQEEEAEAQEAGARQAEQAARTQREAGERAGQEAEAARIRARLQRSRERETAGLRRYRPGPGRLVTPPAITALRPPPEEALDKEILAIERALHEHGPTDREELARMLGSRYWGPGAFAEALRQAVAEGGARRLSRRVYGPPEDGGPDNRPAP